MKLPKITKAEAEELTARHIPYLLTGSGVGPYEIQQGNKAIALLRNTTFKVATHIVKCLNSQPELLEALEIVASGLRVYNSGGEADVSLPGLERISKAATAKATPQPQKRG